MKSAVVFLVVSLFATLAQAQSAREGSLRPQRVSLERFDSTLQRWIARHSASLAAGNLPRQRSWLVTIPGEGCKTLQIASNGGWHVVRRISDHGYITNSFEIIAIDPYAIAGSSSHASVRECVEADLELGHFPGVDRESIYREVSDEPLQVNVDDASDFCEAEHQPRCWILRGGRDENERHLSAAVASRLTNYCQAYLSREAGFSVSYRYEITYALPDRQFVFNVMRGPETCTSYYPRCPGGCPGYSGGPSQICAPGPIVSAVAYIDSAPRGLTCIARPRTGTVFNPIVEAL